MQNFQRTWNTVQERVHLANHAVHGASPDASSYKARHNTARASQKFSDELPYDHVGKVYANILGALPDFIDAKQKITQSRKRVHGYGLSKTEHAAEVDKLIAFNDIIRSIIEQHPKIRPTDITAIVTSAAQRYKYTDREIEMILGETRGIIIGMNHELAFESVLYYLPEGFKIHEENDDAHGADYIVGCPNGTIVYIDVKASPELERKGREEQRDYFENLGKEPPKNELILFSGFRMNDFSNDNPWRPKHEAVQQVLPHVLDELLRASGDNTSNTQKALVNY